MLHPIFSVLVSKPELLFDHVSGYAALMREEASTVGGEVAKRAVAWGVTALSFAMFVVLAGVAVMLGAINDRFSWALVLVPGIVLAVAVAALMVARRPLPARAFSELKAQLDADAETLRAVAARS